MSIKGNVGVLVVEPVEQVRDIIGKILAENGYSKVVYAVDTASAMAVLHKHETDVTLMDFGLATSNNFELLDAILLDDHLYRHPILLLGRNSPMGLVDDALRLGARDFLKKPFTPYLLMVRLEKILFGNPPKVVKRDKKAGMEDAHLGEEVTVPPDKNLVSQQELAKRLFLDGHALLQQKDYDKALKKFAAAARVNTLFPEAYKGLAEVFRQQGNLERSGQFLSKAAETYAWLDKHDEAEEVFHLSQKMDPEAPNPFKTVADHMGDYVRPTESLQTYERAARLTPKDSSVRVALSRAYAESGEKEKAAETLRPLINKGELPSNMPKGMEHIIMRVRKEGNPMRPAGRRQHIVQEFVGAGDGVEKRRAVRIPLAEYAARLPNKEDSFHVVDASSLGIGFKFHGEEFEVGQKLVFDLVTFEGVKARKMQAVVKRVAPSIVGCEWSRLTGKQKNILGTIVQVEEEE